LSTILKIKISFLLQQGTTGYLRLLQQGTTGCLRFSIADDALQCLQLTSEELMRSLFNTTVTDALGSDPGQPIANCYQVPKYAKLHFWKGASSHCISSV